MSNNDTAVRKELDQQIGRVGKSLATEKDREKRRQLRDQGRNLVRRRSYHVDDNEIVENTFNNATDLDLVLHVGIALGENLDVASLESLVQHELVVSDAQRPDGLNS